MSNLQTSRERFESQVQDLALKLVMEEKLDAPETLRALSAALDGMREEAERAGWRKVGERAAELSAAIARRGRPGDPPMERIFTEGIAKLQQAIGEASEESAQAAAVAAAQNAVAQDPELLKDVILESREHLSSVESQLLKLEHDPSDAEAVHSIFRSFHTIKGLAGFLELPAVQGLAHEVETLLDHARNGKLRVTPDVIDIVLASKDWLARAFDDLEAQLAGGGRAPERDNRDLVARLKQVVEHPECGIAPGEGAAAGEVPGAAPRENAPASKAAPAEAADARQKRSEASVVKVDTGKLDYLVDMVGEMVIAQSQIQHDPQLAGIESPRLQRNLAQLARITQDLQRTAMAMRMVPVAQLFRRLPRLVRDLCRKAGKQAELELAGEETELDRTIIEELSDPMVHMIRNSVDHGIETPEERLAAGKPAAGRILVKAYHQAGHILIELSDDGRGIDRKKVLAKAQQKGLVSETAHLSDADMLNLIFEPGFSTAEKVSDVSGRGVGMDVVRRHIQKLRGRIEIQSQQGQGTTFYLKLPLTLAIIDGLVIGVGTERYIVPLFAVSETFRPTPGMVSTVCEKSEMALVRGRLLPVVRLYRRFKVKPKTEDPCESVFITAENNGKYFCLMVDEFVGKQEVVIKSLGPTMKNIPGIAGGAILGDGRVGLVLDLDGVYERGNA
jgi:two-component system chemotaxis sensor kinase CheA